MLNDSTVPVDRLSALQKLSMLHGWRNQVLAQLIPTDRKGPVFHFPARTLDFVATEIGSPAWVASYDVQDEALQKFGTNLPLELRQRLMELGWSEDDTMAVKSDWEKVPVSRLPILEFQAGTGVVENLGASPSPATGLARESSNHSGKTFGKKRRAIFAPVLLRLIYDQATMLAHDPSSSIGSASRGLVRLIQRDDAAAATRPFTDNLSNKDLLRALADLNAFMAVVTPAYAYNTFNSIVGYLKTSLRNDATFGNYAPALASVSAVAPYVSELSLRAIRKSKAEHILLPASIHEEESGFKVHAPWRDGTVPVQTAQLILLADILRANPHEVYLIKKMLSNLQIQASIPNLSFARAWLGLITALFSTVNRNYNDRSELRHFMTNVVAILRLHGQADLLVASYALRVFMLCSTRFRRLFASVGFTTILRSVYDLYAGAGLNMALRDGVEYATRSFFRIHQELYVYQASVVIAEGDYDAQSAYDYLTCLSVGNLASSGVASGLKGLNDKEEIETLLQMLTGPEINIREIRTDAAERQARKLASLDLEGKPFPRENIVKLLLTVIAANPATKRATHFLRLFAALLPHMSDPISIELIREGIEALGIIYQKARLGDDAARLMFHPGEGDPNSDWISGRREYVFLVKAFAGCGGRLSSAATKRTLELVQELLRKKVEAIDSVASSILRELARTHLSAGGHRPSAFLKGIAPIFQLYIASVDFAGLLGEITAFTRKMEYRVDKETTRIIVTSYVGPAIRMLASAAEDNLVFLVPLRSATVDLLAAAVFLQGDALGMLERITPNPSLLASVVLPLCLSLESPKDIEQDEVYDALWVRLLHYVIQASRALRTRKATTERTMAANAVLCLQTLKIIVLRSPHGISRVHGLWTYIAQHLVGILRGGTDYFASDPTISPRIADWMLWSVYELVALHRSPLMVELRSAIQVALSCIEDGKQVHPTSPFADGRISMSPQAGDKSRTPSARMSLRPRASLSPEPDFAHARQQSVSRLTPDISFNSGHMRHSRSPSLGLGLGISTSSNHGRTPSAGGPRPSFVDLSARCASRPVFTMGTETLASPALSASRQSLMPSEKGGTVVQLLNAPNQVLGAISAAIPTPDLRAASMDKGTKATRDLKVTSEELVDATRRAVNACRVIFGHPTQAMDEVRMWTARVATVSLG